MLGARLCSSVALMGAMLAGCASPAPGQRWPAFVLAAVPLASAEPPRATASPAAPAPVASSTTAPAASSAPSAAPTASADVVSGGGSGGGGAAAPPAPTPQPSALGLAPCAGVRPLLGQVATLAGGSYGYADGAFAAAQFRDPRGMAVGADGSLYVADLGNRCVRVLAVDGTVRTLAGGPGLGTFQEPSAVALGGDGAVYMADTGRHVIDRVDAAGAVTVLAGSGSPGFQDAQGAAASFDDPRGLATDPLGGLFVADLNNHRVRHVALDGSVTTVAGSGTAGSADGTASAAAFTSPIGVAADAAGDVFVADAGTRSIRRVDPAGAVTTLAGSGAALESPWAIACDPAGTLFVLDGAQGTRLRRVSQQGEVTTLNATLFAAFGLAANGCGRLFVSDGFTRIREVQ